MPRPQRVALFLTCAAETLYPAVGRACVQVLEALGIAVDFPEAQSCCGQKWLNCGELDQARRLARHLLAVFEGAEAIVAPSASCVDTVRNGYPELFAGEPQWQQRFAALGAKTFEFCEFLQRSGLRRLPPLAEPLPTTYHASCRSLRGLGLRGVAEGYLQQLLGERFIPLPESETCCGFGGAFSIRFPEVSAQLLQDKLDAVAASGARVVTALDLSCLTHLAAGAKRQGLGELHFLHLAELLAQALERNGR